MTGGVGGLSLFDKADLGISDTETFLTGNVGGGVKWYTGRWGLRGDYRFIARAIQRRCACLLRPGEQIRPSRVRGGTHQHRPVTNVASGCSGSHNYRKPQPYGRSFRLSRKPHSDWGAYGETNDRYVGGDDAHRRGPRIREVQADSNGDRAGCGVPAASRSSDHHRSAAGDVAGHAERDRTVAAVRGVTVSADLPARSRGSRSIRAIGP